MSSLKAVEKRLFEDMFGMADGIVLDFTNSTFAEFFRDTVRIDIYTDKYSFNGGSKAKILRAFWEVEPDSVVGIVLSELLAVWKYENLKSGNATTDDKYKEGKKIADRLLGKQSKEEDLEERFLDKDFGEISVNTLSIDSSLLPILETRLKEARLCLQTGASLSVIFLCGSILEGLLLGVALQKPRQFNQASNSPKDKSGKVKPLHDWSLAQFIDAACELKLLQIDVKKFSHALRDFRNYIHPYQQMTSNFAPDQHTAKICMQVLKAAIAGLRGWRR